MERKAVRIPRQATELEDAAPPANALTDGCEAAADGEPVSRFIKADVPRWMAEVVLSLRPRPEPA